MSRNSTIPEPPFQPCDKAAVQAGYGNVAIVTNDGRGIIVTAKLAAQLAKTLAEMAVLSANLAEQNKETQLPACLSAHPVIRLSPGSLYSKN